MRIREFVYSRGSAECGAVDLANLPREISFGKSRKENHRVLLIQDTPAGLGLVLCGGLFILTRWHFILTLLVVCAVCAL